MSADQSSMNQLITDNIDIWTSTVKAKSSSGRGSSKKRELYGVKKLRELILELAVRGKLVPQDPSDEPASVLLEKNYLEQARLVSQENLKTKATLEILPDDDYLSAPISWGRVRLGNLAKFIDYRGKTPKKIDSGVRLITAKNVKFGYISLVPEEFISEEEYDSWMTRGFPRVGDILFTPEAPLGNVAQVDLEEKFALAQRAICFQLHIPEVSNFLKLFLMTPSFQNLLSEKATGTTAKGIKASVLKELLIYLPPEQEQHRIVVKVDELMTLCDQLEQQTEASIAAHQVLVTTLLDTLTNSADADELMQNWARISEHFDTLFTTEASIDKLKQTILQLAVMGKLSKPLDSDTPVSNHLDSILEQQKLTASAKEFKLIEAELANTKVEVDTNRVMLKARCFCDFITKGTTPSKTELLEIGDVPFLKVYNIVDNQLDFDYRPIFISQGVHEGKLKRSMARPGDVIMNIVGPPLGKVTVLTDQYTQWNMNQALAVFKPVDVVFNRYLYYVLSCDLTLNSVLKEVKGTAGQDNLSLEQCRDLLIPVIGIEEQKRLVELVDILLDLCKFLKTRLEESQSTQLHLTDAIVEQAV
ncbi:restriction endonuclease subunit S [Vibrio crassostreae]|uniref:restriction endonuclease subunit S n=1 Tax=Vibrio crassostreae TaxID=246167 RepID=UPI001B304BEA|nr:restriction endonuclease subunit S [Vibrio crassostreae]